MGRQRFQKGAPFDSRPAARERPRTSGVKSHSAGPRSLVGNSSPTTTCTGKPRRMLLFGAQGASVLQPGDPNHVLCLQAAVRDHAPGLATNEHRIVNRPASTPSRIRSPALYEVPPREPLRHPSRRHDPPRMGRVTAQGHRGQRRDPGLRGMECSIGTTPTALACMPRSTFRS